MFDHFAFVILGPMGLWRLPARPAIVGFCLLAGAFLSVRSIGRDVRIVAAGVASTMFAVTIGLPAPDVLLVLGLALLVVRRVFAAADRSVLVARWWFPVAVGFGVFGPIWWAGYDPLLLVALVGLGGLEAQTVIRLAASARGPRWVVWLGRHPLSVWLGHLGFLAAVVGPAAA